MYHGVAAVVHGHLAAKDFQGGVACYDSDRYAFSQ